MTITMRTPVPLSARRRSSTGKRALLALVLLLAAVLGAAVAGSSHADVPLMESVGAGVAAAGPPTATPPARLQRYAVTAMLLPVSGPETRWTQGLARFVWAVRYASLRACIRSHRVPMPLVPPPMFAGFYDIPDLNYIRDRGFSDSTKDPDPHPTISTSVAAVQNDCVAASRQSVQEIQASYAPLQVEWLREMSAMRTDPDVVKAYRTLPTCLGQRGVRAADERSFFAVLAARMRPVDGKPEAARVERELAADYATCMKPIESVRVAKRIELRRIFLARHAADVQLIKLALSSQIEELQRTTGIQITFPAG